MYGLAVIVFIFLPMAALSVVLAALKWRNPRLRAVALSVHLVASLALILFLDGPTAMWVMVLAPGMCLSLFRLLTALTELRARRQVNSSGLGGERGQET